MKIQFDSQADALYLRRLGRSRNAPPGQALMRYAGADAAYLALNPPSNRRLIPQ